MRGHGEKGLFAGRLEQANRWLDAEDLVQPLQGVPRAVGDVGPADEGFEQPHARREQVVILADGRGRRCQGSGSRQAVTLRRGLARGAGDRQSGPQTQWP